MVFDAEGGPPLGGLAFRFSEPDDTHWVVEVRGFARGERVSVGDGWTVFDAEKNEVRKPPRSLVLCFYTQYQKDSLSMSFKFPG